jgi:hypothetical protein
MIIRKHLFLDLEDTIITPVLSGWWKTELINVGKIKNIIETFKPDQVNIFSFALHNDFEREGFNAGTRPMIEDALGINFASIPVVENEIIRACCNAKWISPERVDFMDIRDFWGKHEAFRLWCQEMFKNSWTLWGIDTHVMLLDDDVINEKFEWPDLHIKGEIIDITTI